MTERPIIFSGAMVRAILQGKKQQTRRPVAERHLFHKLRPRPPRLMGDAVPHPVTRKPMLWSPYGIQGAQLWVRETHAGDNLCGWVYRADHPTADISAGDLDDGEQSLRRWTPAIHMKREACRLRLEVTGVRIERLQTIGEADARAEGIDAPTCGSFRASYAMLWDSLNEKRAPWSSNPWVWVIEFKRERKC